VIISAVMAVRSVAAAIIRPVAMPVEAGGPVEVVCAVVAVAAGVMVRTEAAGLDVAEPACSVTTRGVAAPGVAARGVPAAREMTTSEMAAPTMATSGMTASAMAASAMTPAMAASAMATSAMTPAMAAVLCPDRAGSEEQGHRRQDGYRRPCAEAVVKSVSHVSLSLCGFGHAIIG